MPNSSSNIKMIENVDRILAAVSYVIYVAQSSGKSPTQYDIVKSLFLADRSHLNKWGRPITYDNYVAMKHGPVPSLAYDLLKRNEWRLRKHSIKEWPWRMERGSRSENYFFVDVGNEMELDLRHLSQSDKEALRVAVEAVLTMGFGTVRRLTHDDPAYVDAWREDGPAGRYDMKLELLFDNPNPEAAILLAEQSRYVSSERCS